MFHSSFKYYNTLKGAFTVCCNAAALPMYRLLIYRSSTQRTTPQVKINLILHCSGWCRDGNSGTAAYCNASAEDYERIFTLDCYAAPNQIFDSIDCNLLGHSLPILYCMLYELSIVETCMSRN